MTQSGQGEEPSAQPAREGIVLPSDGGEPLLPGMTGAPAPAAPTGGQAWGGSWGPEQQPPQSGQGWPPAAAQQWHTPDAPNQQPPAANPGPLPPEGAPAPSYGQPPAYGQASSYDQPGDLGGGYGAAQQPGYATAPELYQQQPQHHQPQHPHQPQAHQQQYAQPAGSAAPLPPALPDAYPAAAPLPPSADGATQYLPPVPAAPADEGATQYLPPVPAAAPADEGATQYIPPVAPGALPPESAGEETRYLGHAPHRQAPAPVSPDAEATQYIPPYTAQAQGGDRQPPAEFDNLFRGGPAGGDGPAGSTQQMPRVPQPDAHPGAAQPSYNRQQPSYGAPQPSYDHGYDDEPPRRSRVPLIAAVGVGIVVIGVGAGVLLSDGGGKSPGDDGKTVAAASPAPGQGSSAAADPARAQAVELDKLLADSGSSRASVIKAVADVKGCDNLDEAGSNLRDAAKQRNQLVTRLGKLSVDKLPSSGDLTAALTKAWQASAAADNHYAAWAGQAKAHKVCRKGHARTTNEAQAGNRESGNASAQKVKAAALWNTIAQKYGLTQRQPTQL
ncbi:hypothetical protein AQI95_11005 [Streptomyces yokosukanensis]|uniref:Uncharacterized protein n=1 Tax=Streptomyces yokosukanensis TaxID=67386 RepID=A0A101P9P5_9ACTN|nr:hypothetical protein [Streptomyces yokosukanensis]KUN07537.1 hypothetical protein AQI95_11005 [Streptomyces yokosukanensis]